MSGDELRQARERLGLTQVEFARVTGHRSQQVMSKMERRERIAQPTAVLVRALLDGYRPANWPERKGGAA